VADFTDEDDALLEALGVDVETKPTGTHTPREERIIAGFEEIQRFVDEHGRPPQHGEDRDIFERLYAVRLDRIRSLEECRVLLAPLDRQGLLKESSGSGQRQDVDSLDDAELLSQLGVDGTPQGLTELRHVRSAAEKRVADEIANRTKCEDFSKFKPLFEKVESEVKTGLRQSQPITAGSRAIEVGDFFILDGITLLVAEVGEPLKTTAGEIDRRLRVIFANGTESNLLLRSLQRAFYNDPAARRLVSPESGQMNFGDTFEADDIESGTIYVLRSLSDHPYVAQNRNLIHKIGVTGGKVETRIANAEHQATYLLAKVEVIATYKLAGINRTKMEGVFHKLFSGARLNITINDRFGHPVQPEEWFLVPLFVIDEAVERIRNGSIRKYAYDVQKATLVLIEGED
jgi:hypothetical protein